MRTVDGKREWLIAWEGNDERGRGWDDSWEPTCNVSEDLATKLQVAQDNIGFAGGCLRRLMVIAFVVMFHIGVERGKKNNNPHNQAAA